MIINTKQTQKRKSGFFSVSSRLFLPKDVGAFVDEFLAENERVPDLPLYVDEEETNSPQWMGHWDPSNFDEMFLDWEILQRDLQHHR